MERGCGWEEEMREQLRRDWSVENFLEIRSWQIRSNELSGGRGGAAVGWTPPGATHIGRWAGCAPATQVPTESLLMMLVTA